MSTIRATALMHQYTPVTDPPAVPPSLKRRAAALAFPLLLDRPPGPAGLRIR